MDPEIIKYLEKTDNDALKALYLEDEEGFIEAMKESLNRPTSWQYALADSWKDMGKYAGELGAIMNRSIDSFGKTLSPKERAKFNAIRKKYSKARQKVA